jgi:hypothetical protein
MIDHDKTLVAAVEDLLRRGDLDKGAPAYTVAQKIVYTGYDSLTRTQKVLYDLVIVPALKTRSERT